ncbi:hypothetical protein IMCC1989_338 [gamma proteobacterium IMCC1989]|nr:hypothetical protein IMCC1989_338 [gamma proteobacterium IMCC1989]
MQKSTGYWGMSTVSTGRYKGIVHHPHYFAFYIKGFLVSNTVVHNKNKA